MPSEVSNSMKGVFKFAGSKVRRPGSSRRANSVSFGSVSVSASVGATVQDRHQSSSLESVHFTVRVLLASRELKCRALESFETKYEEGRLTWWRPEMAAQGQGIWSEFVQLYRPERRHPMVNVREEKALKSEIEMLRMCFAGIGTNCEAPTLSEGRPGSSDKPMPLGPPTELARLLLPLLGESKNPTLHYPQSDLE